MRSSSISAMATGSICSEVTDSWLIGSSSCFAPEGANNHEYYDYVTAEWVPHGLPRRSGWRRSSAESQ